jgi:hypothetical protein
MRWYYLKGAQGESTAYVTVEGYEGRITYSHIGYDDQGRTWVWDAHRSQGGRLPLVNSIVPEAKLREEVPRLFTPVDDPRGFYIEFVDIPEKAGP